MHFYKLFCLSSVALLLLLCNTASADDATGGPSSFAEHFKLGGYASAGITAPRDAEAEIALHEISLILTWQNESRFKFFAELELETPLVWDDDNDLHTKKSFLDLERLYLDYNLSEEINLRAGRFLTPTGRWNQLHAAPLVWTSSRPLATSRLFPIAANGLMAFGAVPVQDSALEYALFWEALKDQVHDDHEIKFDNVKGARLSFGQTANFGLSFMSFNEKGISSPNYRLLGLDFITHYQGIELTGEAFQRWESHNQDGGSGAYLQTAIPLSFATNWSAIARVETLHRPDEGHDQRWLVGTTWRIKPNQLLKLELTGGSNNHSENLAESPRGFAASFAVLF
ncbi:MAG: hypothetical protein CVU29_11425 [Betaproteobacteria bacterium HGW-Betaproteobacteria-22]|nr:MAG: hypothetical protein CVU29_11425 [Betaproteobacteria bacterium HGW-Betaproteobacteria-22]